MHFERPHPGQFSLLPSAGREMSTSQSAAMLCGWGVKAGMVHSTCGIPRVPYLSALEMSHDKALYKSTFTNLRTLYTVAAMPTGCPACRSRIDVVMRVYN